MLDISRRDIAEAFAHGVSRRGRGGPVSDVVGPVSDVVGTVVGSVETLAGAGVSGALAGRFGALRIGGTPIPLDATVGFGLHVLGLLGLAGDFDSHLHRFADGILAGYVFKVAYGYGADWRAKSGEAPQALAAGNAPRALAGARRASPLTAAELAAMANAVK